MTPERWQEIKTILAEAMERPLSERDAFVERASVGDGELRREVFSLLAAGENNDGLSSAAFAPDGDAVLQTLLATALGQQYEIIRSLGRGGMGAVYLARERALERFVAIKVLRPDLAAAPDSRERFRREARVAAQLSHAGILPLHTFGEVSGIWYFVMGYVRGVSLAERLRLDGQLPPKEAHRILAELAEALECAHRNEVIHRDIKPANILLDDESGRAMLADFGISKVRGVGDTLTAAGTIVGTPRYMSPEQSLGKSTVDGRSDIYSLGAVGYTMLCGREPFADVKADDLTLHRLSHDPVPIQAITPSVPPDLASIVMRCLAREPEDRWPDARSLRDALARANGDALSTLPESLRDLPTFGPYALLWAVLWLGLAIRTTRSASDRVLLALIGVVVPFGFILHVANAGLEAVGAGRLARVAFWPPEWWGMWWPRALRRPMDLWRRLPWQARAVRVAVSVFLLVLPTMILLRDEIEAAVGAGGELQWFGMVESALVLGVAIATIGGLVWAYGRRLTWSETARILFGATAPSPGWTTPTIDKLLAPTSGATRLSVHDAPAEHLRAIVELAASLPDGPGGFGDVAVEMAHRMVESLEHLDAQILTLSRDAGDSEVERLTARLSELAAKGSTGDDGHRELTALVRRELDLLHEMRGRRDGLSRKRAEMFDALRELWSEVSRLRSGDVQIESALSSIRRLDARAMSVLA